MVEEKETHLPKPINILNSPPMANSYFGLGFVQDMKKSRFSEEQIIGILRETEAGSPIKAVCAAHNISTATYHAWKRKFGGMEVSEAKRLRGWKKRTRGSSGWWPTKRCRFTFSKRSTQKSGEPVCKQDWLKTQEISFISKVLS